MAILSRVSAISPFGPIFGKELRSTARRKRTYLLRSAYLVLLLLAMLVGWLAEGQSRYGGLAERAQKQADLGAMFFAVFSFFCVVSMGLIGPVLTCTAIGSERLAKTLPVLLMTPINTWQIIGGKLFSRLLVAMTLLGLSLPVLALVRLLGGVELEQMLGVLAICTTFVMATAAIGLFYSTLMNRAYAVILLSYATLGFLYALLPFLLIVGLDLNEREALPAIAAINSVFAIAIQSVPESFFASLRYTWTYCAAVNLLFTVVLVFLSAMVLRRIARTERSPAIAAATAKPLAATTMAAPCAAGWPAAA